MLCVLCSDKLWHGFVALIIITSVCHVGAFVLVQQRSGRYINLGDKGMKYARLHSKLPKEEEEEEAQGPREATTAHVPPA